MLQRLYQNIRRHTTEQRSLKISQTMFLLVGRDSSLGVAVRYGLDGLGIESRCGRDFPFPSRPGPTQSPIQWVPGHFPGCKGAGA